MALAHHKIPVLTPQQIERFHSHVERRGPDECWPWTGNRPDGRYGKCSLGGQSFSVHRVAYMLDTGVDPGELFVCHTCDNPPCTNPAHLFLGTCTDNRRDCRDKGRLNIAKGERGGLSKLKTAQVESARQMYLTGRYTHQQIADQFRVTRETISLILRGKNWAHLPANGLSARVIGESNKSRATSERNHRCAKLTDDDVREIKRLKAEGRLMQKEIARRFEVTPSHISIIVNGKFKGKVT